VQFNGKTYAFSSQWGGKDWLRAMNALKERYPQFRIGFAPAASLIAGHQDSDTATPLHWLDAFTPTAKRMNTEDCGRLSLRGEIGGSPERRSRPGFARRTTGELCHGRLSPAMTQGWVCNPIEVLVAP
jgi:hypothetical protein